MIKKFEKYGSIDYIPFQDGDKVMVKYKDSAYFMRTGKILYVKKNGISKGDCMVALDYDNIVVNFYYTNLMEIIELIEVPSGEVVTIFPDYVDELVITGLINYDNESEFYYFDEENRWQIDHYII